MHYASAGYDEAIGSIGTAVGQDIHVESNDLAVSCSCQAVANAHRMTLGGRGEDLLALQQHLDWATGFQGHQRRRTFNGYVNLTAEGASHHRLDHPYLL